MNTKEIVEHNQSLAYAMNWICIIPKSLGIFETNPRVANSKKKFKFKFGYLKIKNNGELL